MRTHAPFRADDLVALDGLLEQATAVVTMAEIHAGVTDPRIIGLRHDVDNVIEPAVEMAAWEAERGYRSTYFVLHTAPYWRDKDLLYRSLEAIVDHGHEIGIHNNALAESVRTGRDPRSILVEAIVELHMLGHTVKGTVAHGDNDCYGADGKVRFVNDELFTDCVRPELGNLDGLKREPLASFDLDYDANWLERGAYLSDSSGRWSAPGFDLVEQEFPFPGQLHMLVHPDWWQEAFVAAELPVSARA